VQRSNPVSRIEWIASPELCMGLLLSRVECGFRAFSVSAFRWGAVHRATPFDH
jgi:hypothetical protein